MSATIAKISEKVSDAVSSMKESTADAVSAAKEKVLGAVSGPKERSMWSASAEDRSKPGRPARNTACVYKGPNKIEMQDIGYPKMQSPQGEPQQHGVILKVVASGICGSDLHMYRGSTAALPGLVFGHEITGQVCEMGTEVERWNVGDYVSVPFNISCGKCDNCREGMTSACLKCNPKMPGAAYGFALMGGWNGGQAEYVYVPYADFQLLRLPDRCALDKISSLAFLSDIFPTGYNGCLQAGVKAGSIVYIAGAGPVGLCAARSAFLLGASCVFIADQKADRLKLAEQIGCHTINLSEVASGRTDSMHILAEMKKILPPEQNGEHTLVDCSVECVGYEACGCGAEKDKKITEQALNTCFMVTKAGGGIGIPGIYPIADPLGVDADRKSGVQHLQFGVAWNKGLKIGMGQCPVAMHNKDLLKTITHDRVDLGSLLNVQFIRLDEVPAAYERFNKGEAIKFVVDPHGMLEGHHK